MSFVIENVQMMSMATRNLPIDGPVVLVRKFLHRTMPLRGTPNSYGTLFAVPFRLEQAR
jgi:hypothetical protein